MAIIFTHTLGDMIMIKMIVNDDDDDDDDDDDNDNDNDDNDNNVVVETIN